MLAYKTEKVFMDKSRNEGDKKRAPLGCEGSSNGRKEALGEERQLQPWKADTCCQQ